MKPDELLSRPYTVQAELPHKLLKKLTGHLTEEVPETIEGVELRCYARREEDACSKGGREISALYLHGVAAVMVLRRGKYGDVLDTLVLDPGALRKLQVLVLNLSPLPEREDCDLHDYLEWPDYHLLNLDPPRR